MENRGGKATLFGIAASIIGIVAIIHTLFYFSPFLLGGRHVSGFAFIEPARLDEAQGLSKFSPISLGMIIAEWAILIIIMVKGRVHRISMSAGEIGKIISHNKSTSSVSKTDLDILYEALKEKKEISLPEIARAFKVEKSIAMDWAKTLEDSNLATIEYSRMGEASLKLK